MDTLEALHDMTARQLLQIVTQGVPVVTRDGDVVRDENDKIVFTPAAPAYFAQAVKLLKDNGIEAIPAEGNTLGELAKQSLPTFEDDEDPADLPQRFN
jgi:protein-L-isoaspartate O-methyltransferase